MKDTNKKPTSFLAHLAEQYGKPGSEERQKYEQGFETAKREVATTKPRKKRSHKKKAVELPGDLD